MFKHMLLTILGAAAALFIGSAQQAQAATLTVNCGTGGNLQTKIDAADTGSTILVKGTCVGNFQISGKGLTLKGNPSATLDGNSAGTTLALETIGRTVHLVDLTVTGGLAEAGGGIHKLGGKLTLNRVIVRDNRAAASTAGVWARGGGIESLAGKVTLTNSKVIDNFALSTGNGTGAIGAGLDVAGATLTIKRSVIARNLASDHPAAGQARAFGGGFYVSGSLSVSGSKFLTNTAVAHGTTSGRAYGSAGYQSLGSSAVVTGTVIKKGWTSGVTTAGDARAMAALMLAAGSESVTNSRIVENVSLAQSSSGDAVVTGAGVWGLQTLRVSKSTLSGNTATAQADTAQAIGAGGYAASLTVLRSTVNGNKAVAQATNGDAYAQGGGLHADTLLTLSASTVSRNLATTSTSSVDAAQSFGAGVFTDRLRAKNSTIALNTAASNAAAPGASASAAGAGAVVNLGPSSIVSSTIAGNMAVRNAAFGGSVAGGILGNPGLALKASIVANNTADLGPDCFGALVSTGHNLIRTLGTCLVAQASDRLDKKPKLGALRGNGGPTQTMAIAKTSPARNAIAQSKCAVGKDQRRVHRPQAGRCDIGAYERRAG